MSEDLRITLARSGGFAGLSRRSHVDTSSLPAEEAERVRALVEQADFFSLPSMLPAGERGADRFQYELTVESGGRQHTVQATDGAAPERLQPLLAYLAGLPKRADG
jgi:hypothetical protein